MGGHTPGDSPTVLIHEWVTGGGLAGAPIPPSWAAEGRAMRRAIAADFAGLPCCRVLVTIDERLGDDPGPWTCVPVGAGEEPRRFASLASEADYTVLIAPETGGILAERAELVERSGGRSLGATPEAIALAADKLRLNAHLGARGIPAPQGRRVRPADGLPSDFRYPAVLKPIDGAGSLSTLVVERPDRLPEGAGDLAEGVLEPMVAGTAMSATFLVGPAGGAKLLAAGRQAVAQIEARLVYRGGTLPAGPDEIDGSPALAIDSVPGLRGLVGVDYVWDAPRRRSTVIEINPRPTTSVVALTRLLGPGQLARAWIETVEGRANCSWRELARRIRARSPLEFLADGTFPGAPRERSS